MLSSRFALGVARIEWIRPERRRVNVMLQSGNVTLMVTDLDRSVRFYTGTLGFRMHYQADGHWAEVGIKDLTIGLHPAKDPTERPARGEDLSLGLQVESLESAMDALRAKGVRFERGPVDDQAVRLAFFSGHDGYPLYLCEVKR